MAQMSETQSAAAWIRQRVGGWTAPPNMDEMNEVLRRMGRWRSRVLAKTYIAHHGLSVMQGPFAGMIYADQATEGALIPRLLGSYESELHPHLQRIAASDIDTIIDVGCAEGYYAVGLARLMPQATVHARDIDEAALAACRDLAAKNGVADRVRVAGAFKPQDFQAFAGTKALVMVDTEGAEVDILRPDLAPALAGMQIIVETHDLFRPGALATMTARFQATHDIVRVDQQAKSVTLPAWLNELGHLDQLLAVWEWRQRPTPWLVMTPKG